MSSISEVRDGRRLSRHAQRVEPCAKARVASAPRQDHPVVLIVFRGAERRAEHVDRSRKRAKANVGACLGPVVMTVLHAYRRLQQIRQADTVEHFRADAIEHREADAGSVLGRIDMHTERSLAEGRVDHLHDRIRHR